MARVEQLSRVAGCAPWAQTKQAAPTAASAWGRGTGHTPEHGGCVDCLLGRLDVAFLGNGDVAAITPAGGPRAGGRGGKGEERGVARRIACKRCGVRASCVAAVSMCLVGVLRTDAYCKAARIHERARMHINKHTLRNVEPWQERTTRAHPGGREAAGTTSARSVRGATHLIWCFPTWEE